MPSPGAIITFDNISECRIRKEYAAENLSRLRRLALNQYNNEKSRKHRSLRRKRSLCARDARHLLKTLPTLIYMLLPCVIGGSLDSTKN